MGFGKDGKGVIIADTGLITLATLANVTALKEDAPLTIGEDFRLIKVDLLAMISGATPGEGPLWLYLVNDELTVAEIAEAIEASGPLDRNDRVAFERATRAVFMLGMFPLAVAEEPVFGMESQRGFLQKVIRWTFSNPEGFSLVIFNQSGGTLTTGATVRFAAKYYGVWLT